MKSTGNKFNEIPTNLGLGAASFRNHSSKQVLLLSQHATCMFVIVLYSEVSGMETQVIVYLRVCSGVGGTETQMRVSSGTISRVRGYGDPVESLCMCFFRGWAK